MQMTLGDINEIEAIRQLKYRYLRGIDTHDFDLLESCFVEDATVWYSSGRFNFAGRATIIDFMKKLIVPSFISSHIVTHPELELTSVTTAKGIWRLQDQVFLLKENEVLMKSGDSMAGGGTIEGAAYYYDEYRKEAEDWKISSSGFVRIFEAQTARNGDYKLKVTPSLGLRTD